MSEHKKILIVDDEIDLQQLVKLAMKSKGFQVETANNGLEALEKLQTFTPDLVILDMNMPKMGGVEFYQQICAGTSHPKYPILVLTARANMEKFFKEFNIDGFMAKPFEVDDLLKEVDLIIQKRSGLTTAKKEVQPFEICVAEHNQEAFQKIALAFLNAGFIVNPARNGTEAIERISASVPNVGLINLGLLDIPGDMVILKLKKMAKTQDVKYILYTDQIAEKGIITERISQKEGIDRLIFFSNTPDLIQAVNEVLKAKKEYAGI
jgi:DNA-binding response OmpR family regulator